MQKLTIALFVILIAVGCRKPFIPQAISSDNNKYLVIEGVINTGTDSTFIKISRTQKVDTIHTIDPETKATVSVESDANSTYSLAEITAGTYAAALNLDPSHKYRLRIKTAENKEYLSDFVVVKNAPPIDSVGFIAQSTGVQIYVNTHDASNNARYYRWDYTEAWQFHAAYKSTYKSNGVNDLHARTVSQQVYNCFGNDASSDVIIASSSKLVNDNIYQAPIIMIPSTSEKIETKYSILVRQYALTTDAYTFWQNIQNNTEKIGSIFDVLPSENQSNFHCVTNPNELVVGYLSVGSYTSKRIFIAADQLLKSYGPIYPGACEIDTAFTDPPHQGTLPISGLIPTNSPYVPLLGLPPFAPANGAPTIYTYSTVLCADCTVRGSTTQPAFWK